MEEEITTGRLSARWPLLRRLDWRLDLTTAYEMKLRSARVPLRVDPFDTAPRFPDQGRFAAVRAGLSYSSVHGYLGSISAEDGVRIDLAVRVEDPLRGAPGPRFSRPPLVEEAAGH